MYVLSVVVFVRLYRAAIGDHPAREIHHLLMEP